MFVLLILIINKLFSLFVWNCTSPFQNADCFYALQKNYENFLCVATFDSGNSPVWYVLKTSELSRTREFVWWYIPFFFLQEEVTKYEELEEASAELKLKRLLWDSLTEWDTVVAKWMQVWILFFSVLTFMLYNNSRASMLTLCIYFFRDLLESLLNPWWAITRFESLSHLLCTQRAIPPGSIIEC